MGSGLIFLPEAKQDLVDGFLWYEDKALGLGLEFLRSIEACILSIQRQPLMYQPVHENYRRALIRRFPYLVFYQHESGQTVIFAVFHCAQNPDKWNARIAGQK